jgi:hypothetical protein
MRHQNHERLCARHRHGHHWATGCSRPRSSTARRSSSWRSRPGRAVCSRRLSARRTSSRSSRAWRCRLAWTAGTGGSVYPSGEGELELPVRVERSGRYDVLMAASFRNRLEAAVDGVFVGSAKNRIDHDGMLTKLGEAEFGGRRPHRAASLRGIRLAPRHGGRPVRVRPARAVGADRRCARLNWVEAVTGTAG